MLKQTAANRSVRLLGLLALGWALPSAAAPVVTVSGREVVVSNEHLKVVVDGNQGGAIREIRRSDGRLVAANFGLYTDRGIYGDGVYVGTGAVQVQPVVSEAEGKVTVRSEGTLRTRDGAIPREPGALAYYLECAVGDGAQVEIRWGLSPGFSWDETQFLSLIFSVTDMLGLFANTDDGVLLQDAAAKSGRTFQSVRTALSPSSAWLGVMHHDGTVRAFDGFEATAPLANIFLHENGQGQAAVFFAWYDAGAGVALGEGVPMGARFTLSLWDGLPAFNASHN